MLGHKSLDERSVEGSAVEDRGGPGKQVMEEPLQHPRPLLHPFSNDVAVLSVGEDKWEREDRGSVRLADGLQRLHACWTRPVNARRAAPLQGGKRRTQPSGRVVHLVVRSHDDPGGQGTAKRMAWKDRWR